MQSLLKLSDLFRGLLCHVFLLSAIISCSAYAQSQDPYLWLENIAGKEAMEWVHSSNALTDKSLAADPLFAEIYADALNALDSKDKLPDITLRGDWIYKLKKDARHPRGVYLRSSIERFNKGTPEWITVLDIDALSKAENIKWVFHGMECLKPANEKCLVYLSPGGGDAHQMREFNASTLRFVDDGFRLPTAKMRVNWMDENHLFVGTDFGAGSMTDSGYPRLVKIWKRNTSLDQAKQIFNVDQASVWGIARRYTNNSQATDLLTEAVDYWTRKYYQYADAKKHELMIPKSAVVEGMIDAKFVISLQKDWKFGGKLHKQGSVVLVAPKELQFERAHNAKASDQISSRREAVQLLLASQPSAIIEDVRVNKNSILVTVLEDVKSRVYRYKKGTQGWQSDLVDLPKSGQILIETSNDQTGGFFARYEGFLTPPTLYAVDDNLQSRVVLQQSATFDSSKMKVEQFFTKSTDGTRVPYFVVMNKNTKMDGTNPTQLFSYGGFRASLSPSYSGSYEDHNGIYGKAWLERGGVFVLANIRGGGEYGPAWHAAALLENRTKSFEDFEAVAEDLITRKITSAKHLGIEGRSNGGLLVAATMQRRPELYGAVICGMPLADMKRYNKLLAGASWMAEYGNPDTDDWKFIKKYSPYQNLQADAKYPPVYFFTSTKDDRVHPGHARKMAAKMKSQGHQIEYFENTEGGHKGSATSEQTARRVALGFTHLWRELKQ